LIPTSKMFDRFISYVLVSNPIKNALWKKLN